MAAIRHPQLCDNTKIFMWSQARSGGIWEDLLTDKAGQYIELQSGRGMQQQTAGCEKSPFKYQTLVPGATDAFEEQWGVAHEYRPDGFPSRLIARPLRFPPDYDTNSVYALYRDGEQKMRAGTDVIGAAKQLKLALEKDPCFVPALGELAAFELRRGNLEQAEQLAEKALAVDTYDGPANFIAGEIALDWVQVERARERFGVAALDAAYRPAALVRLGMIALCEKNYQLAGQLAEKALACSAYDPEAHQLKAVAARLAGDRLVAMVAADGGLRRTPIHYGLRYERGEALVDLAKGELPGPTLVELGLWYAKAGRWQEALNILSKINVLPSEFNKEIPRLWNRCHRALAEAALKAGDKATAHKHVDAALSFPENLGAGRPVNPLSAVKDWPAELTALRSVL